MYEITGKCDDNDWIYLSLDSYNDNSQRLDLFIAEKSINYK